MKTNKTSGGFRNIASRWSVALLAGAALLAGCSDSQGLSSGGGERLAVKFTATPTMATPQLRSGGAGSDALNTRTTDGNRWVIDDEVGVFMLTAGGRLPGDIVDVGGYDAADNRKYIVTDASAGTLQPAGASIYYPQSGSFDFIAYYPYGDTGTGAGQVTKDYAYRVSVGDQSDPAAIDVLYAKTAGVVKSNTPVGLKFDHSLAKLVINVKAGEGIDAADITALAAAQVSIIGMPATADLTLDDGTAFTGYGNPTAFHPLKTESAATGFQASFEAIIIPQPSGGTGRTVVFTVRGLDYTWAMEDGVAFRKGNIHTYEITVNRYGITIIPDSAITPWTESPTVSSGNVKAEAVRVKAGTPGRLVSLDLSRRRQTRQHVQLHRVSCGVRPLTHDSGRKANEPAKASEERVKPGGRQGKRTLTDQSDF